MTDTDIVTRLAREAGLEVSDLPPEHQAWGLYARVHLARFAALVAEECAKVCDNNVPPIERYQEQRAAGNTARDCAAAIRARFVHSPKPLT